MKSTTIQQIWQGSKSKNSQSICPFEQSQEERKLQVLNQSFTPFKVPSISFPPNTPHKHLSFLFLCSLPLATSHTYVFTLNSLSDSLLERIRLHKAQGKLLYNIENFKDLNFQKKKKKKLNQIFVLPLYSFILLVV